MSQIEKRINTPDVASFKTQNVPPELAKYLKNLNESLMKYSIKIGDIFNRGIRIEDNLNADILTVTFLTANVERAVAHSLKRIPNGFIVINLDRSAVIYSSGKAWTLDSVYLLSTVSGTVAKLLIL